METNISEDGIQRSLDEFAESSVLSSESSSESSNNDFSKFCNNRSIVSYDSSTLSIHSFPVSKEFNLSSVISGITLTTTTLTITRTAAILTIIIVTRCDAVCHEFEQTTGAAIVIEVVSGAVTS